MWEHLFNLAESGTTILISTHLMDEAERCHRLTIMNEGNVVADGSVLDLKNRMQEGVLQVDGDRVTPLVARIKTLDHVLAVNQVGISLRVLTAYPRAKEEIEAVLPADFSVKQVHPSIEDVFVKATSRTGVRT